MDVREMIIGWYESNNERYRIRGDKLFSRCVVHDGDNDSALVIDLHTASSTCYTRGCKFSPYSFFGINKEFNLDDWKKIHLKTSNKKYSSTISNEYYKLDRLNEGYTRLYSRPTGPYLEYILSRGFGKEEIQKYQIGCVDDDANSFNGRLSFPIRNRNADLVNFCFRLLPELEDGEYTRKYLYYDKPKLNNFYNLQNLDLNQPVVLTEGVIDNISLEKCGIKSVISPMSVNMNSYQYAALSSPKFPVIIFAFDNIEYDEASTKAIERAMEIIGYQDPNKMFGVMIPPNDFKDWNKALTEGCKDKIYTEYREACKNLIRL